MSKIVLLFITLLVLVNCSPEYVEFSKITYDLETQELITTKDFTNDFIQDLLPVLEKYHEDYYFNNDTLYIKQQLQNDYDLLWNYCRKAGGELYLLEDLK